MCAHVTLLNVELKSADAFCVGSVPLGISTTNSSPLYAPHPIPIPLPSTIFPSGSPSLHPLWTAYARGCGAEAAARVGAWAGLGCTQCKAAGDWHSPEGKRTPSTSGDGLLCLPGFWPVSWVKELFVERPCETYSATKVKVNRNETEVKECMIFSTLFLAIFSTGTSFARASPSHPRPAAVYQTQSVSGALLFVTSEQIRLLESKVDTTLFRGTL